MSYNYVSYNNLYNKRPYNTPDAKCNNNTTINNNYYNNYYNNNKELIKVDVNDSYYLNVTLNDFNKIYELFIINANEVYLPLINNDLFIGFTVKVTNMCEHIINTYTQQDQLIYSNMYHPKQGDTKVIQKANSLFIFTVIKKNDIFSWVMI